MLPRSTSTPVILGQYDSVMGVGIAPIIPIALGALGVTAAMGYLAGRQGTGPTTLAGGIGIEVGKTLRWVALGAVGYKLVTGKSPLTLLKKPLFKRKKK